MVTLNSCEIIDELRKLGIEVPDDLLEYLKEYETYRCHRDSVSSPE